MSRMGIQQVIIGIVKSTRGISTYIEIELNNFAVNLFHKTPPNLRHRGSITRCDFFR